jgi:SAM (Sterile alpha motif) domain-containing protein
MSAVRRWLVSIGLAQYADAFETNEIGMDLLSRGDDQMLKDLGVSMSIGGIGCESAPRSQNSMPHPCRAQPAKAASDPSASSAERRQVTVMSSDLVGSTALSARMDPEDLLAAPRHRARSRIGPDRQGLGVRGTQHKPLGSCLLRRIPGTHRTQRVYDPALCRAASDAATHHLCSRHGASSLVSLLAARTLRHPLRGALFCFWRDVSFPAGDFSGPWSWCAGNCRCGRIGNGDTAGFGTAHRTIGGSAASVAQRVVNVRRWRGRRCARICIGAWRPGRSAGEPVAVRAVGAIGAYCRRDGAVCIPSGRYPRI